MQARKNYLTSIYQLELFFNFLHVTYLIKFFLNNNAKLNKQL